MRIEIWSDVVCPWCYIGKRRFEHALERFPHRDSLEVVHRSFQLDPRAAKDRTADTSEELASKYGCSVEQARAMMAGVEQTAAEVGIEFHLARTRTGNTADAHRVLHLAKAYGRQDGVVERFYRAYFTEGQSLFDHDSLVLLAAEAGLDPDEVRRVLRDGSYAEDVEADIAAGQSLGVTGVPFFVVDGRYGISGAQAPDVFVQALAQAWRKRQRLTQFVPTTNGATEVGGSEAGEVCATAPAP